MKHHIVQYMLGIPTIHTWYEQLIYHRPAPVNAICQESRPFRPAHGSMNKEMLSALSHIIVVLQSEHKFLCTLTGLCLVYTRMWTMHKQIHGAGELKTKQEQQHPEIKTSTMI
jgi:hypothetical protein